MKKWLVLNEFPIPNSQFDNEKLIAILLEQRGLKTDVDRHVFLHPPHPIELNAHDVGIDGDALKQAISRIEKAIKDGESIVVFADYDADGITAGAVLWEALHRLGAKVMPYIPHRVEEGYGLSVKGIDAVREKYNPTLIITVDNGIGAVEKVAYAKSLGIEVIVTDHHTKLDILPDCTIVHTTSLCGAGIAWFVAKELLQMRQRVSASMEKRIDASTHRRFVDDLLSLAAIGTIADMVPLLGANRSIVKYGLAALNQTNRVGLKALMLEAGMTPGALSVYDVSHGLAPRLNAMGRLVHALDALRLLCTKQEDKAMLLARTLGLTNKERQQMTMDMAAHAKQEVELRITDNGLRKLLFISHESYNPGVIGLVAGKLMEEYYRPSVVLARGELVSKASARSIAGFNIIEAIRANMDILVDAGGHPMAAGFTVETKNLELLKERLEKLAGEMITDDMLTRVLRVDAEIPLARVTEELWSALQPFQPFGLGNYEPVFVSRGVTVESMKLIGNGNKHLKLRISSLPRHSDTPSLSLDATSVAFDAIAFSMGELYPELRPDKPIDIAYIIDMNEWNGKRNLQLKIRDIHFS